VNDRFIPTGRKDVLFVFDEPGAWTRYRCDHQAEQFTLLGKSCDIAQSDRIDLSGAVDHYDTFILNRVQWNEGLESFFECARRRTKPVLFDTDDLIFEPDLHRYFAVFDGWPEAERAAEIEKLARYRRTLEECDGAIVTTEPLGEYARKRTDRVMVVHNAVSAEMVRAADDVARQRSRRHLTDHDVVIAYFSGTRTHNRDFLEAADAVLWALETYPRARFLAVGKLDVDPRFDRFRRRVKRVPLQDWRALPRLLSRVDINLSPLERENPFTECKSCVKYLEAGLPGVPTIASPRSDFVRAIDAGRNGLFADDAAEWRDALRRLIESPRRRVEIGEHAARDVRANHTTKARVTCLAEALSSVVPTITES
jgi:glycosyltransferase involved in cell wall biosynthesis